MNKSYTAALLRAFDEKKIPEKLRGARREVLALVLNPGRVKISSSRHSSESSL
jgi:hypothetical protein